MPHLAGCSPLQENDDLASSERQAPLFLLVWHGLTASENVKIYGKVSNVRVGLLPGSFGKAGRLSPGGKLEPAVYVDCAK